MYLESSADIPKPIAFIGLRVGVLLVPHKLVYYLCTKHI